MVITELGSIEKPLCNKIIITKKIPLDFLVTALVLQKRILRNRTVQ